MKDIAFAEGRIDFPEDIWSLRRFRLSLDFVNKHIPVMSNILDLGTENGLSYMMRHGGYNVTNTRGEDLDLEHSNLFISYDRAEVVTAFEILEHLVNPFGVLMFLPTDRLIASVPLRLRFAKAYNASPKDRHFHEFEAWQFDWLLEEAGWKILDREYHTSPTFRLGLRSILRWVTPRWYFVYAIKA